MCFASFPVAKRLWERGGEGVSRVSVERFYLAVPQKIGRGTHLCCVSETFGSEKNYG